MTHRLKNKRENLDLSSGTRIPELIVELSSIEMKENERKLVEKWKSMREKTQDRRIRRK